MTPLAVFAYNRPAHVDRALASLARCDRRRDCRVHVFCDGPRGAADAPAVEAARRVVRTWAPRLDAVVVERDRNRGLAGSIVSGVTGLCEAHGRVIVLEDDLTVAPDFLSYMLQALDRYADVPRVRQVSGFMFPVDLGVPTDAVLLPVTTTWGWATWDRAWRRVDWDAADAREALADPATRRRFDLDDAYPYARMLEDGLEGRNDSWGIRFWWSVFRADGLAVHPGRSRVRVGGMDGTGAHGAPAPGFAQPPESAFRASRLGESIAWPEGIAVDPAAWDRFRNAVRDFGAPRSGGLAARVRRRWDRLRAGVGAP